MRMHINIFANNNNICCQLLSMLDKSIHVPEDRALKTIRARIRQTDSRSRVYVTGNNKVPSARRVKIISDLFPPRLLHAISLFPGEGTWQIWSRIISRLRSRRPSLDQLYVFGLLFQLLPAQTTRYFRRGGPLGSRADKFDPETTFWYVELTVYANPTIAHLDLFHQDFAC